MTLIARITFRGIPLYIGDLLLSRDGPSSERIDIPTIADINSKIPSDAGRSVVGLRQKVNIIGDRLIVAWSGNLVQARALIRDIAEAVDKGASTHEEIGEIIVGIPEGERNDLSLIGTILTRDTTNPEGLHLSHFNYCAETFRLEEIEVRAAGTGADDLIEAIPQMIAARPIPDCDREDDEFHTWVLGQAFALAANFVGHENTTGANILDWWGGAFEVATLVAGRFQKVSNVLHTSWRAIRTPSGRAFHIAMIPKFLKYDYFQDALVAQTLELSAEPKSENITVKEHTCRVYTPLLKNKMDYDFSKFVAPTFSHNTLCCFLAPEPPIPELGNLVYLHHNPIEDALFRLALLKDQIQFGFKKNLIQDLESAVSAATGLISEGH